MNFIRKIKKRGQIKVGERRIASKEEEEKTREEEREEVEEQKELEMRKKKIRENNKVRKRRNKFTRRQILRRRKIGNGHIKRLEEEGEGDWEKKS